MSAWTNIFNNNERGSLEEFKVYLKKFKDGLLVKLLATPKDLYLGSDQSVVFVHHETLNKLQCLNGDGVRIFGKYGKETVLIILSRVEISEENTAYLGRDIVFRNLGISEGDYCYMKLVGDVVFGNRIHILPLKESISSNNYSDNIFVDYVNPFFNDAYRPVSRNDLIEFTRQGQGNDKIIYSVVSISPSYGCVVVAPTTIIDFEGEPVDWSEPTGGVYYNKKLPKHQSRKIKKIRKTIDLVIRYPLVFKKVNMKCPNVMMISSIRLDLKRIEKAIFDQSGVFTRIIQPNEIKNLSDLEEIFEQMGKYRTSTITIFHNIEEITPKENQGKDINSFMTSRLEIFENEKFLENGKRKNFDNFNLEKLEKDLKEANFNFFVDEEAGYGGIYLEEMEKEDTSPFGRGDLLSSNSSDFVIFTTTQPRSIIDPDILEKVDVFIDVNDPLEESDFLERIEFLLSQIIQEDEVLIFDVGDDGDVKKKRTLFRTTLLQKNSRYFLIQMMYTNAYTNIPKEIFVEILKFCDLKSMLNLTKVNREIFYYVTSNFAFYEIWAVQFRSFFFDRRVNVEIFNRVFSDKRSEGINFWYDIFKRNYRLRKKMKVQTIFTDEDEDEIYDIGITENKETILTCGAASCYRLFEFDESDSLVLRKKIPSVNSIMTCSLSEDGESSVFGTHDNVILFHKNIKTTIRRFSFRSISNFGYCPFFINQNFFFRSFETEDRELSYVIIPSDDIKRHVYTITIFNDIPLTNLKEYEKYLFFIKMSDFSFSNENDKITFIGLSNSKKFRRDIINGNSVTHFDIFFLLEVSYSEILKKKGLKKTFKLSEIYKKHCISTNDQYILGNCIYDGKIYSNVRSLKIEDTTKIVGFHNDLKIQVYDINSKKLIHEINHKWPTHSDGFLIGIHTNKEYIVTGTETGDILIFDRIYYGLVRVLSCGFSQVITASKIFFKNNKVFVIGGGDDKKIVLWET